MTLAELLRNVEILEPGGAVPAAIAGLPVRGVHYDSRRIEPGWAFVAIRGEVVDGNNYTAEARERGASVVVSGEAGASPAVAWVRVARPRAALAQAAANWFHHPAEQLRLVGITGTNGKTTTAFLIEAMLRGAGMRTGLLGTIEYHIGEEVLASPHTTPESYELQALLARMVKANCGVAVMEVSSHALALERVWGCAFTVAVFTNLTQDHLDFHRTMGAYGEAKRRLFTGLGAAAPAVAVVNADDPAAAAMTRGYGGRLLRYGLDPGAEMRATGLQATAAGLAFTLEGPGGVRARVESPLLGRVNALNLLAALGTGHALGLDLAEISARAAAWPAVRGRFERVYQGQPFAVVVDYAHTPDALRNVCALARELVGEGGKVRLVFGCGGDRDKGKRPLMGQAAMAADWVMVTSDNPRSEAPEAIIADILAGMGGAAGVRSDRDRRAAIQAAVADAEARDVVVIAGKGHEDYQIVGAERLHFDDAEEARAALRERGWAA